MPTHKGSGPRHGNGADNTRDQPCNVILAPCGASRPLSSRLYLGPMLASDRSKDKSLLEVLRLGATSLITTTVDAKLNRPNKSTPSIWRNVDRKSTRLNSSH